jgi:hypothetical protein
MIAAVASVTARLIAIVAIAAAAIALIVIAVAATVAAAIAAGVIVVDVVRKDRGRNYSPSCSVPNVFPAKHAKHAKEGRTKDFFFRVFRVFRGPQEKRCKVMGPIMYRNKNCAVPGKFPCVPERHSIRFSHEMQTYGRVSLGRQRQGTH